VDVHQIKGVRWQLGRLLEEFDDCLGLSGWGDQQWTRVRAPLSNLSGKSVEPIAWSAKVAPGTLQGIGERSWLFKELRDWGRALGDGLSRLARNCSLFHKQKWQRLRIKGTEKGLVGLKPVGSDRKYGPCGLSGTVDMLTVTGNLLCPNWVKHFLSNLIFSKLEASSCQ